MNIRISPALPDLGFHVLSVEPDTLIYYRDTDDEVILVVTHRGENSRPGGLLLLVDATNPDGASFEELANHKRIL